MVKNGFPRPAVLLLCMLVLLCGLSFPCPAAAAEKDLTLMIYMAGSDLETQNGAASADIREMLDAGCDFGRMNVVILAGGAERWHLGLNPEELSVLQLGVRGMRVVQRLPQASMGQPDTLTSFLNYAVSAFPAKDYALIFWNHGGGPMEGVCYDEKYNRDRLSLPELDRALAAGPFSPERPLSWIGFDACLMASVEAAGVCSGYARYMIASQETEPFTGWNYSFLAGAAASSPEELGPKIVDAYMAAAPDNPMLTLSCVNLSRMGTVMATLSGFFTALRDQLNADTFSTLSNLRRDTRCFGRTTTLSDYDLADLGHLCSQYAPLVPEQAAALQAALDSAVICNSSRQADAHGLSIYSPYYNKTAYGNSWLAAGRELNFSGAYSSWISRYASFWLGDQLADWTGLAGRALPAAEDGSQTLELDLTRDQEAHFADARVVILRDQGYDNAYFKVFEIADLRPEEGVLRARYDFSGLYVLDENGAVVSDIYPFTSLQDGLLQVIASLEKTSYYRRTVQADRGELDRESFGVQNVSLICSADRETGTLEVRDVIMQPEDPGELTTGKQYISIAASEYPYICFSASQYAYYLTRDRDTGRPLPYSQWPSGSIPLQNASVIDPEGRVLPYPEWNRDYHEQTADDRDYLFFGEVNNARPWSLQFLKGHYSPQRLYAQFIVTDTQGVEIATELIPLHYPALADTRSYGRELYRDDRAAITLESVDVVEADSGSGLYLRFRIENNTDYALRFAPVQLTLNRTGIDDSAFLLDVIEPHSVMRDSFHVPAESIPYLSSVLNRIRLSAALWTVSAGIGSQPSYELFAASEPVSLECGLDLSALGLPEPGSEKVWAVSESEDLTVRLLDLSEAKDGSLQGIFHFISRSRDDRAIRFYLDEEDPLGDALMNGCYLRDVLHAAESTLRLSAGYDLYVPFSLSRIMQLDPVGSSLGRVNNPFSSGDGFAYWEIDSLRRLTLPVLIDGNLRLFDFSPASPLPLTASPASSPVDAAPAVPLLRDGPLSLNLRSVRAAEPGAVRLMADIRNDSGETLAFRLSGIRLNGEPAACHYYSETALHPRLPLSGWITVTPEEGAHRILIDLIPENPLSPAELSGVTLRVEIAPDPGSARSETDLNWAYTEPVRLLRQEGPVSGDLLPASAWEIHPAGLLPELDLSLLLGGNPAVPERPEQYACRVWTVLSAEELQSVSRADVFLVLPRGTPEEPDACLLIAGPGTPRLEGSCLTADFSGLLACAAGSDIPFYQSLRSDEAGSDYMPFWIFLNDSEGSLFVDHLRVALSGRTASAATRAWEPDGSGRAPEQMRLTSLESFLEIYRLPGLPQGRPAPYAQWEYLDLEDVAVSLPETGPGIVLRPASDWEDLRVVFSLTGTDGSAWAVSRPLRDFLPLPPAG